MAVAVQKFGVRAKPPAPRSPNHEKIAAQIFGLRIDRALAPHNKPYSRFFPPEAGTGCWTP